MSYAIILILDPAHAIEDAPKFSALRPEEASYICIRTLYPAHTSNTPVVQSQTGIWIYSVILVCIFKRLLC